MNSLAVGASTRRFLDVIPESVFGRAGVPSSRDRFMSCVANTEFDTTLFVNVLLSVTSKPLSSLPVVVVPQIERKVAIYPATDNKKSHVVAAAEPPDASSSPPRRM